MRTEQLKLSYQLSVIIAILSVLASAGGLFLKGLYRDSDFIRTAWLGNDLVTLAVAVPILVIALLLSKRGSERAQLVWMGLLGYMFYNYAFYLFGAAFNGFFLIYVALFALSIYALAFGLFQLDVNGVSKKFSERTPVKWISIYLLFISLPLGVIEGSQCINFLFTGKIPEPPALIFALDLSIVVPNTALAAVLLWRRKPWGYVLGSMMLVKAFIYGVVLCLSTALIAGFRVAGNWDPLMPFYGLVAVGGLVGSLILLSNLKTEPNIPQV